jgi:hypothetical protein
MVHRRLLAPLISSEILHPSISPLVYACHMAYAIREACRNYSRMETMRTKIDVIISTLTK